MMKKYLKIENRHLWLFIKKYRPAAIDRSLSGMARRRRPVSANIARKLVTMFREEHKDTEPLAI